MSSPCLSGGGRTYGFDLEIVKSSSTSSRTSHTSSPSSTISESSNSPLAISTRKPRTTRKRPNQTYNEAAALLSTAYPNVFSSKHLTKPSKFTKPHDNSILLDQSPDLLLPFRVFDNSGFLLHQPIQEKPRFGNESKVANFRDKSSCQSSGEVDFHGNSMELCDGYDEDFDAESILDEEIEEGIDSIMGNLSVSNEMVDEVPNDISPSYGHGGGQMNSWHGDSMGYNFGGKSQFGHGMAMRRGVRALRQVDEGNWWHFPIVDMLQISPRLSTSATTATATAAATTNANGNNSPDGNSIPKPKPKSKLKMKSNSSSEKKKKKVELPGVVEAKSEELEEENPIKENSIPQSNRRLILKLNYDSVLNAWSDRGSPFSDETIGSAEGTDVCARLAQIDLFSENGMREASVLRYKEKRRTRLFSKKIRYQVRKVNADQRPRMKGRFVRRPNSSTSSDEHEERKRKTFKL
uniref:CCT domain-containing protein n=1 Tax=Salix viminalis TaxID=40686 RepID=A0A6N2N087_SALVM